MGSVLHIHASDTAYNVQATCLQTVSLSAHAICMCISYEDTKYIDSTSATIANIIETVHVPHLSGLVFEGEPIDPPTKISW